jgi:hypothetical protein
MTSEEMDALVVLKQAYQDEHFFNRKISRSPSG